MHQLVPMEDGAGVTRALRGLSQMPGYNLRVFIGPISRELSEAEVVCTCVQQLNVAVNRSNIPARITSSCQVAANLTSSQSVPILLPFVSLPDTWLQRDMWFHCQLLPLQTLH